MSKGDTFYFPSLDGLRFFAFLVTFLLHALYSASYTNIIPVDFFLNIIKNNGWAGVDLFLVLSSFLITAILLREREKFGRFSLKRFYIRRTLRIWPLYYLALIVGFVAIPAALMHRDYFLNPMLMSQLGHYLPLYGIFLGNWSVIVSGWGDFNWTAHLWTISMEEQFYIFWPLVLLLFQDSKKLITAEFALLFIALALRILISGNPLFNNLTEVKHINTLTRLDTFMLGAIVATLYIDFPKFFSRLTGYFKDKIILLILSGFLIMLSSVDLLGSKFLLVANLGYVIIDVFFAFFVACALIHGSLFTKILSLGFLSWLGKISYGLYVWHMLGLMTATIILRKIGIDLVWARMVVGLFVTLAISVVSYYYFEKIFLKFKDRFTSISTRPI